MLDYIMAHPTEFATLGAALVAAGGIIVKLTPTKTDDRWWRVLMSAIGRGKE